MRHPTMTWRKVDLTFSGKYTVVVNTKDSKDAGRKAKEVLLEELEPISAHISVESIKYAVPAEDSK